MTRKHTSIDRLSNISSRQAQSEAAMMQHDLKKLRDSIANMSRSIKEPVIKTKRGKTKKTISSISIFGINLGTLERSATRSLLSEVGLNSTAQRASSTLTLLAAAQRIR